MRESELHIIPPVRTRTVRYGWRVFQMIARYQIGPTLGEFKTRAEAVEFIKAKAKRRATV